MRKFSRGLPPVDMAKAKTKYHNQWDKKFIESAEHTAIGDCLYKRQAHYCAYCEIRLATNDNGFIEHLERRADNPKRTFDWSNMFFSCNHSDSCGNYKDNPNAKQQFNPADIVDPSVDDPADFFIYDVEGNISAKDDAHKRKAEETIRIFNLNNTRLKNIRSGIAQTITYLLSLNPSNEELTAGLQAICQGNCPSVCDCLLKERLA